MSAKISGTFLRAALGPIQYAAGLVSGNKVLQGVEELAPSGLVAGLKRGINEVSALAGVSANDLERAMPMALVEELAARLSVSQPRAVAAWKLHAGQFGFMDVITALTMDGRKAEIGLCLDRVAKKVSPDPELAEPLAALAVDVTAWEELIVRCRNILDDRDWLAKAYARKRMRRWIAASVPVTVIVASLSLILIVKGSRDRIDHALETADPCLVRIDAEDVRFASRAQDRSLAGAKLRCKEDQERQRRTRAAVDEAREIERRAADAKQAHLDACQKIATSVTDGSFRAATAGPGVSPAAATLLERVATKKLEPSDVGPVDPSLPCGDTPSLAVFESAYGAALAADVTLWARQSDPSTFSQRALEARKSELPINALAGLAESAERTAKEGLTSGKPEIVARAKRLCSMAHALQAPVRGSCNAAEKL